MEVSGLFIKKGLGILSLSLSLSFFQIILSQKARGKSQRRTKTRGGTYLSFPLSQFPSQLVPAARQADLQNIFSFPHSTFPK